MNSWRERFIPWLTPTPREAVSVGVLLVGAVALTLLLSVQRHPQQFATPVVVAPLDTAPAAPSVTQTTYLTVHVSGAVVEPGVTTVDVGARVYDAIAARGGLTRDADVERVNLARLLTDGEHVHIPRVGEPARADEPPAEPAATARLNLNTADATSLTRLPGIGPAKADAIITYRATNGPFTDPGQLRNVPGIGEATFQRLAPLITVR